MILFYMASGGFDPFLDDLPKRGSNRMAIPITGMRRSAAISLRETKGRENEEVD